MKFTPLRKFVVFCVVLAALLLAVWIKVYSPFRWQHPNTDFDFVNLKVVAHGGDGSVSSNAKGVQLTTKGTVWETFSFDISHDLNFAGVDYSVSIPSNSALAMWMDGKPMQLIQNAPKDELKTYETFPLRDKLSAGRHNLTVSFESLDKKLITVTLKGVNFALAPSIP